LGSDLRYSLINTFSALDTFRQNIIFNLQGAANSGFATKKTNLTLNTSSVVFRPGEAGSSEIGTKALISAGTSELRVGASTFDFTQGSLGQKIGKTTSLAINGEGFFAVAESLQPGARVFLTRNGDFSWKDTSPPERKADGFKQFHLTNKQGLFVLRFQDIDLRPESPTYLRLKTTEPPAGMLVNTDQARDATRLGPPDGSDWVPDRIKGIIGFTGNPFQMTEGEKRNPNSNNSNIAILRVPLKEFLQESSFGGTIFETNIATRAGIIGRSYAGWVRSGDPIQVQSESSEDSDFTSIVTEANILSEVANFVFKNLREALDNYNRSLDELLGLVR
jgi:hypothetical protein